MSQTFYKFKYLGVNIWEIIQQLCISLSCDKISLAEDYFGCFCRYWYIAKHVKKSHREFYCFDFLFFLLQIICPGTVYLLRPVPPASSTSPNFLLFLYFLLLLTRFHMSVPLFSNRSQMMSKSGKNEEEAH